MQTHDPLAERGAHRGVRPAPYEVDGADHHVRNGEQYAHHQGDEEVASEECAQEDRANCEDDDPGEDPQQDRVDDERDHAGGEVRVQDPRRRAGRGRGHGRRRHLPVPAGRRWCRRGRRWCRRCGRGRRRGSRRLGGDRSRRLGWHHACGFGGHHACGLGWDRGIWVRSSPDRIRHRQPPSPVLVRRLGRSIEGTPGLRYPFPCSRSGTIRSCGGRHRYRSRPRTVGCCRRHESQE